MDQVAKNLLAARVARDIPNGSYVNLGIGLPTLVANHLPRHREIILHSENGVLGQWSAAEPGQADPDLINAGKEPVRLEKGAAFFHHADAFGMMRGGHLDICVLGAFQVSGHGDLANWHTGDPDAIPAVGGAMDLAIGARRVFVMMDHMTRDGASKLRRQCSYPLTGLACVSRVYTELGTFAIGPQGVAVIEIIGDMSPQALQSVTDVELDFTTLATAELA